MFPVGSTNSTECVDVSITDDDDAVEGDETFTVTLMESENDVMLGNSETTVTIMDNEGYCKSHTIFRITANPILLSLPTVTTVSLPSMLSFGEDGGTVQVCAMLSITPSSATTANPVTVSLATGDATPSGTRSKELVH